VSTTERQVIIHAFAAFVIIAKNAPGPAMKRLALERAGNCLWALEMESHGGIKAVPLPGLTIEGEVVHMIEASKASGE
jgi:hypothetical protein